MWNNRRRIKYMVLSIIAVMLICSFSYAGLQSEITISTFGAIIQNIEGRDSDDYMAYQYTASGWTITPATIYYWVHGKDPNTTSFTPDSVTLKIYKGSDLIKTKELPKAKGEQQTTWDGKITSDTLVEPGEYTATIDVEYDGKKAISREHNVIVLKVEIENITSRDSDDIQIQRKIDDAIPVKIYYKILPVSDFVPDSVKLKVLDKSTSVVREQSLSILTGEQITFWDGKDNSGEFITYGYYKVVVELTVEDVVAFSNLHNLTVYMVRLGNNVYRDMHLPINEHSGILYAYTGRENIREELDDTSKYLVIEHPGGKTRTTHAITLDSFIAVSGNYYGPYCPSDLTKEQRKKILSTAHALYSLHHRYTQVFPHLLEYKDTTWEGTISDIARLRCDGVNEVSYEANGILLWGTNIMSSQENLEQHYNNFGFRAGCTPQRERLGGGGANTTNQPDHLYLPTQ